MYLMKISSVFILDVAFIDVEELSRGRKGTKSLPHCIGILHRPTIYHTACILPCHTSYSFAICCSGETNLYYSRRKYYIGDAVEAG